MSCSLRKGDRTTGTDPETGEIVRLFNPRVDSWSEHFDVISDSSIVGKTPTGRAAVTVLRLNHALAVSIRSEEAKRGRYP